ncbi:MAG TPA: response regulator [Bacteroidia bacterium]|uniref:sensor histidine kinase n=1 Tax=Candidatus Pollutiaquabacter sp. TaxID=3416354 RepID=UPI002CAC57C0|nr:response regulator [Bacteroidota bacterium]HPD52326.1 response regulator [Bacteroidia bacterium]HRS37865.1 response regulator [Bacteroidia bacterium]
MQATVSPSRPDTATQVRPVKLLIVDDRPENILSLESILEGPGREILKAESGNEALRIALKEDIAVMLLDVQMPEMDGFEVARLLKENSKTRDISIIFVTALSKEERYTMQGYEEGAVDYLHKPLDVNVVKAKVAVFEKLYRQKIELRENAERLESVNKQLGEFVYIVSHDLKAPLRGLASLASFMEEELGAEPKVEVVELLNMMKSRTARMQQLIDGILHYSRMANNRGDREDVDLNELINSIIDLIAPASNVVIETPDNLPVILAERVKLHEVLQNLIINGIKYNDKAEIRIKIAFEDNGSHYRFHVTDNGVGIRPEHQEKIFGIFQTLQPKDQCESTGIGLTIVKKIIEQQEGAVTIASEVGSGTTFSFTWKK